jgi:LacI family transcriptional regulator
MRRVTVHDLARTAGVSLATVDRVRNRRGGVRAATIEKVEQAVDRLGYRRAAAAATLAKQREYRFACVIPTRVNLFLPALADGARLDAGQERIRVDIYLRDNLPWRRKGLERGLPAEWTDRQAPP